MSENYQQELAAAKARIAELEAIHENPMLPHASLFDSEVRDYDDFVDRVCTVIVARAAERPNSVELREAMRLFWTVSPFYIATAMVMMRGKVRQATAL